MTDDWKRRRARRKITASRVLWFLEEERVTEE
jgi:hypothetical protein